LGVFFYTIFRLLYAAGIHLASLWNPKARAWVEGRRDIFEKIRVVLNTKQPTEDDRKPVWMHCASLGEFEQGRPILEKIRADYPKTKIVLTFFSPSGYEAQKDYKGADYIFYLPMDSPFNAKKFLDILNPAFVLFVKYEFWFYYLKEINQRKIPLLLVSAVFRRQQSFFKWYGGFQRSMLSFFTQLFVQDKTSAELLAALNINALQTGDTRFDRVVTIAEKFTAIQEIEKFCGTAKVVVAGSTWPEDEEELDHFAKTHPEIKFIIAPHEIYEEHLTDIEKLFQRTIRFSMLKKNEAGISFDKINDTANELPNVLIIDNIGMLAKLYYYATVSYVGGGFGGDGVHNVLEAAVYGKPVLFGPVYEKYIEATELVESGGGISVNNALELEEVLKELLSDEDYIKETGESSKKYVLSKQGATGKIIDYIQVNRLLTN
jgi:3-deoxy-D-manno-octulosonic-acid transferase